MLPKLLLIWVSVTGRLYGFEFKWSKAIPKPPTLWLETYPEASFEAIHPGITLHSLLEKTAIDDHTMAGVSKLQRL